MNKIRVDTWITLAVVLAGMVACNGQESAYMERNQVDPDSVKVVSGYGRIGAFHDITDIIPEVNGVVRTIFYQEGDSLDKGDTIMVLKSDDVRINRDLVLAELAVAASAISILESKIETAQTTVQMRKALMTRTQQAYDAGTESLQRLDEVSLQYEQARGHLNELVLQKDSRNSEYEAKKLQLRLQTLELKKHWIQAPGRGILLSLNTDENKAVHALKPVGTFGFAGPFSVNAEIDELYAREVENGMGASVVPYGRDDTIAWGAITFLAPQLSQKSMFSKQSSGFMDRRVREVEIRIDSIAESMLPGQRVQVYVDTK